MADQLEMVEQELRDERRNLRSLQRAESDGRVATSTSCIATYASSARSSPSTSMSRRARSVGFGISVSRGPRLLFT